MLTFLSYVAFNQAVTLALLFRALHREGCWYKAPLGGSITVLEALWVLPVASVTAIPYLLWRGFEEAWK